MKNLFNVIAIVASIVVAYLFFEYVLGDPSNFLDPEIRHQPKSGNTLGYIYTGGPLVSLLIAFILIACTFVVERFLSIAKAQGKGQLPQFVKAVQTHLANNDIDAAIKACDTQRGSLANIIRSGLDKYNEVKGDDAQNAEKKMLEVKRAIDEATNLETPLLEKNMVILSTIASIATMVGLLGTTVVSATQLSIGISEALYNTAGGLIGAVICIVFFNFFTTKIDQFVYMIDEAILSMTEILTVKLKK